MSETEFADRDFFSYDWRHPETRMFQISGMRARFLSAALLAPIILTVQAQFVAFNDHAPGPGTSPNATTYDIFGNGPQSGPLKDVKTGATLPVILTITTSDGGLSPAGTQGSPAPGTPLYEAFNGFVDFQGTPSPSVELTPGGLVTYTFTGLNPNKRYTFQGSAVRGNAPYTDRWTLFELAGALSFTSDHTANVLTTEDVELISPNQAAMNTGVNNTAETGDMVVWENIDPGPEGSFSVSCQQYDGPVPNGSSGGNKGYGMTGIRLEEFDNLKTPPEILTQPESQIVNEAQPVTFSAAASGNPAPTYQWYKNNSAMAGETNTTLTIEAAQFADDSASFKVIAANTISNVTYTAVSSNALLHVTADTTPPTLVEVQPLSLGQIKLLFSERIAANANDTANYSITSANGSVTIASAALDPDQTTVILNVSGLTENVLYTLRVSGVHDLSSAGNVIPANTQQTFAAITYTPADVGSPTNAGSITAVAGGYDIQGNGADIGGTRDQFHFAYQEKSGDFDVRVRLADLTITDSYVKAGLMVRENLSNTARFAAIFASSAQLGSFFESRLSTASAARFVDSALKFPANYPWAWLRLKRSGSTITGYGSFDGQAWQTLGVNTLNLPDPVLFGMAVTSGTTNTLATAKFRDISPVQNATDFRYAPVRESIGPSNRRTGLIFSEVMYHSRPRADGKNLDFIEIYNGEPIFVDLTGWKISGGIDFAFPDGFQLQAGQFAVIAADPMAMEAVYGVTSLGPYSRALSDTEDKLTLKNQAGAVRAEFTYSSEPPWPTAAAGVGHSLVCLKPSYGEEDVRAWGASQLIGGSPGLDDPIVANPWNGVTINEFLALPGAQEVSYIELFNTGDSAVDLSGCYLTDSIATNKFRLDPGTTLQPRATMIFTQYGFNLSTSGGTIYLIAADESRVLDCIRYEGQERGVSIGRSPDGGPTIRRLTSSTPGSANAPWKQENIVINELMYKPISGDDDDEFIELYNRSANAVDLSEWRFIKGIDYTFPAGTSIPGNGYLVVARRLERMLANYPQLNATNTVGNFSGKLRSGERIALAKPGMNTGEYVAVSEVSFLTGGRWPDLANGNGSSLELRDVRADPALPSNWAASDETGKSAWASYEVTGQLTLGNQNYPANKVFIMSHGSGEYLIDDIEVIRTGSTNVVTNSGFESGQSGWTFYGTHRLSQVRTSGAFSGNNCLYVRATEGGDEGPNSIRGLMAVTIPSNAALTMRAKIRWLSGWPEILLRIRGNGIELPVKLQIPANLGTPGLVNSRKVSNAGPAITEVTHFPTIPAANQPVLVTARISDPDGVVSPQVLYRIDPSGTTTALAMRDDGAGGDVLAGDGIYSATLPPRTSGLVAFRIQAQDLGTPAASSIFPNDAPARECLVRWADPTPFGSLAHYHLWATSANQNDLTSRPGQDRSYRDCTIVYDNRTIYNAGWRNKGSPFHSGVGSYSTGYPDDDLFLGSDKHVLRSTGNGGDESTEMADDMSYWIADRMGLPFNHARYVRVYRNGTLHYRIDYDLEVPDRSIARDWFGGGGLDDTLYKVAGWFEYDESNGNGTSSLQWATFQKRPSSAPPFKTAAYRFNFQAHPGGRTANDYSLIFNLVAAANASDKVTQLMNLADMENWMRTFAHRRIIGDWDHWSYRTGQNMYLYAPLGERARLMPWDMDFVLGMGESATLANLFSADQDSIIRALFNVPAYRRMLWRAYQDAVNGPLDKAVSDPQFDARRNMLVKNNISATSPTSLKSYVASRRNFIQSQIRSSDAIAFNITTSDSTTANSTATITGIAPFGVATIEVNGTPYPVTWTGFTTWSIKAPLGAVTNVLQIVGKDLRGGIYTNAVDQVTITYTGSVPQAKDWVVINEIMYNALAADAEYIEIFNSHPTYTFDLSNYRLKGADFTFPNGSFIPPNGYLLVVKDSAAFASAYGATIPIAGEYSGRLLNTGETISLVKPGATQTGDILIDEVHYDSVFPWPDTANGFGPSLQRIDPAQDSWRAGNWSVTAITDPNRATPGRANVNRALLDPFPAIWINELLANNQTGAADGRGERDPWIELYNAGSEAVDLSLYSLGNDPLNISQWQFPSGTTIGPGQFLVIWGDGQAEQTTETELHTNFRLSATGGLVVLSRIQLGATATVDYLYYPATQVDQSYGAVTDGNPQSFRLLYLPTPGSPNNPGNLLVPVSINEWMSSNVNFITDPADTDFDDWFELYNAGTDFVDLTGYVLSDETTNVAKFRIPAGYGIAPHGFLLVWADDETSQNSPNRADLHVNFKMSKDGDTIALFTPNGAMVDSIIFGAQADNVSGGRYPDGAPAYFTFTTPTPLQANDAPLGPRFFRISLDAGQLTIGWRTTIGRKYRLESKSDLGESNWTPVGEDVNATSQLTSVILNFSAIGNRYFRVIQLD